MTLGLIHLAWQPWPIYYVGQLAKTEQPLRYTRLSVSSLTFGFMIPFLSVLEPFGIIPLPYVFCKIG